MRVIRLIVNWACLLVIVPIIGGCMFTLSFMLDARTKSLNGHQGHEYRVMTGKGWIW